MIAAVALAALLPASVAGAPVWCEGALSAAGPAADTADDSAAFSALAAALPRDAPVLGSARTLANTDVAAAAVLLHFAVADACARTAGASAAELSARTDALLQDARFTGVRKGDGTIDQILHKVWLAIVSLLESQGMQQYAGNARVIYLSLLAGVAVFLAALVGRKLLRQRRADKSLAKDNNVVIESERAQAFAMLRERAAAALGAGDARAALRAGEQALLARVGELDAAQVRQAITPARTHKEMLARLPAAVADVVRAPFASFDALFFGRPSLSLPEARAYLCDVDAAALRLADRGQP